MQQFFKGRTNNHLTWVMVDATDFATPESALSAAMKIKIYGKLRGAAGVNFVSSGTGSLTNDITHVGASVLGIYSIGLAKADLSDASAAWYDQYIISLSATGAAFQTLVVDGGIDHSALSAYQSRLSDILSAVILTQSMASDAASAAIVGASRILLVQSSVSDLASALSDFQSDLHSFVSTTGVGLHASVLSDIRSAISAGPAATVTASDISDIASAVWANAIGARVDSRLLLNQSRISDIASFLVVMSGIQSDLTSKLSDMHSDLRSQVSSVGTTASDLASVIWNDAIALLLASRVSDLQSKVSDVESNLLSLLTTTGVQLNASMLSDVRSAISAGPAATVTASDISDIASAVRAAIVSDLSDILSAAVQANSRALVIQSMVSDVDSALTSRFSDIHSFMSTTGVGLNPSTISDVRSAISAGPAATVTASDISDIASAVYAILVSDLSNILSAAVQTNSRALVILSQASDIYSLLSDVASDVTVISGVVSDIRSGVNVVQINGTTVTGDGSATPWGPV